MSECWLSLLQNCLTGIMAHVQQRYLELFSEVEQWGVYDPYVGEVLLYLAVMIPLGYLAERIPLAQQWKVLHNRWLIRNSKQTIQKPNLSKIKETESC